MSNIESQVTTTGILEQVKSRAEELKAMQNNTRQIIDNKNIQIYANTGAKEVQRAIRSNSYTYANLEE